MNWSPALFLKGVEWIWLVWAASLLAACYLTVVGWSRIRRLDLKAIARGEEGAGYTISYAMVIPVYVLFICLVLETTFMLLAKIGTVYAAFAGARTAIVWNTATTKEDCEAKAKRAAIRAMAPFAGGVAELRVASDSLDSDSEVSQFADAYREYVTAGGGQPARDRYVRAKYSYARKAVTLTITEQPQPGGESWEQDLLVKVEYSFPFNIPIVGDWFGRPGVDGHQVLLISSEVVLQDEAPQNKDKRLGINYASPPT